MKIAWMISLWMVGTQSSATSIVGSAEFLKPNNEVCVPGLKSFQKSIYPLVVASCTNCHGDNGKYLRFAVSDPELSYQRMLPMQKFEDIPSSYFVKQGGSMVPTVSAGDLTVKLKEWWDGGEKTCERKPAFETQRQLIPANLPSDKSPSVSMRWSLDHLGEDLKGSWFELEIQRYGGAEGPVKGYVLSKPRLLTVNKSIQVAKLSLAMNGKYLKSNRVFSDIDMTVTARPLGVDGGKSAHPVLTSRGIVLLSENPGKDELTIGFGTLKSTLPRACRYVERFRTDVVPVLQDRSCYECHGGGLSANPGIPAAKNRLPMNISEQDLCASFVERLDFKLPESSPLLVLPDYGAGGHGQASVAAGELTRLWSEWLKLETEK